MGWDNLPQEVLLQILQQVQDVYSIGLTQCQLTCQSWNKTAQILIYTTVTLKDPTEAYKVMNTISRQELNKFVKNISFESGLAHSPQFEDILPKFFELCPYILKIDTMNHTDESFWTKLLVEYYKGNLNKVKELPMTDLRHDASIKIHGYVTMKLIKTLKRVQIWDWPQNEPSFQNNPVALNLSKFSQLEHLMVYVCGIYNASNILYLIQRCKKLKNLNIINHPKRRNIYSTRDIEEEEEEEKLILTKDKLIGIKVLETDNVTITNNLIQQFIHLLPNLQKIKLNATTDFDFHLESEVDQDKNFLYRMQIEGNLISTNIWNQFISHIYNNIKDYELSLLFFPEIELSILNYLELSKFKERNGSLKILYVRRHGVINLQPYVGISSKQDNLKIVYETREFYNNDNNELPHMDLLERFGNKISHLIVSISPVIHFGDEDNPLYNNASGHFLDHIFKYCTELNTLMISNAHLISCNPNYCINNTITILRLNCLLCPSVLTEISKRLPNLTKLVLYNVYFVSTSGLILERNKNLSIDVRYSSLHCLTVKCTDRAYINCTEFHLKISGFFYMGNMSDGMIKSDKIMYNQSLYDKTCLSIDIVCLNLKEMYILTRNFYVKIIFKSKHDFLCSWEQI